MVPPNPTAVTTPTATPATTPTQAPTSTPTPLPTVLLTIDNFKPAGNSIFLAQASISVTGRVIGRPGTLDAGLTFQGVRVKIAFGPESKLSERKHQPEVTSGPNGTFSADLPSGLQAGTYYVDAWIESTALPDHRPITKDASSATGRRSFSILVPTPTPTPTPTATRGSEELIRKAKTTAIVNLREGPTTEAKVIDPLPIDTEVTLTTETEAETKHCWVKVITLEHGPGWVRADNLDLDPALTCESKD